MTAHSQHLWRSRAPMRGAVWAAESSTGRIQRLAAGSKSGRPQLRHHSGCGQSDGVAEIVWSESLRITFDVDSGCSASASYKRLACQRGSAFSVPGGKLARQRPTSRDQRQHTAAAAGQHGGRTKRWGVRGALLCACCPRRTALLTDVQPGDAEWQSLSDSDADRLYCSSFCAVQSPCPCRLLTSSSCRASCWR